MYPARFVSVEPSLFVVGGVQVIVSEPVVAPFTAIENAGSAVLTLPSLTEMTMPEVVPTFAEVGTPDNWPVLMLNDAQLGLLAIEKLSVSLSGSLAVGRNEYVAPTFTDVAGVPVMVGARLGAACTVIENGASEAVALPSLTLMVMPDVVPTLADAGVPVSRPVVLLNVAHAGLFAMEYVSASLSASLADGWNE